jgi:hypothetical protein
VSHVVAIVFDFDDTLVPDSTSSLLREYGVDPARFWKEEAGGLVARGYDPTLAFLNAFLDYTQPGRALDGLTNAKLRAFGATLDAQFHRGLPALFDDLNAIVAPFDGIAIEYYIISGGLKAVIEGSAIVGRYFTAVYGCELDEAGTPPVLARIKRSINFTEKTRYLFEINKGIDPRKAGVKPFLVNLDVPAARRRVQLSNMIYVGDGLTDIPCFSLLKRHGGTCFGVFDPTDQGKAKRALIQFLKTDRVISMHSPRYEPDQDLGSLLRAAVANLCSRIVVAEGAADV